MHSRIFGITSKEDYNYDIKNLDDGEELKLPYWDYVENLPYFADYVNNEELNLKDDKDWLFSYLKSKSDKIEYDIETGIFKIHQGFKQDYFKDKYEKAKKFLENFDDFCEGKNSYELRNAINEEYSFYQADEFGGYQTIDEFIKFMKPETEYVIFDSIDYHM